MRSSGDYDSEDQKGCGNHHACSPTDTIYDETKEQLWHDHQLMITLIAVRTVPCQTSETIISSE